MSSSNLIVDITLLALVLLSIATWSIALIKIRQFRGEARASQSFLGKFWGERSWLKRGTIAQDATGEFARIALVGYQTCRELSEEQNGEQSIESTDPQELRDIIERQLHKQTQILTRRRERGLAELATIGSTSPFIGLFGTVWGIMNALKTITASGNASIDVVAGPIGEALIATAVGIATAVPAVLAYNYFLRQQRVHLTELNGFQEDFLRQALRHRQDWSRS